MDIRTALTKAEQEALRDWAYQAVVHRPAHLLEIGAQFGASTVILGQVACQEAAAVLSIDHHRGNKHPGWEKTADVFIDNLEMYDVRSVVLPLVADTQLINWLAGSVFQPGCCTFGFVDADHTVEGIKRHTKLARYFVDGLLAYHDYNRPQFGVTEALAQMEDDGELRVVEVVDTLALVEPL